MEDIQKDLATLRSYANILAAGGSVVKEHHVILADQFKIPLLFGCPYHMEAEAAILNTTSVFLQVDKKTHAHRTSHRNLLQPRYTYDVNVWVYGLNIDTAKITEEYKLRGISAGTIRRIIHSLFH